jgi:flagellar basal-body rod protein FlgB
MAITDATMDVIYSAMQGLQARQKVNADNIANLQTPGFRAGQVDFETSLKNAVATGDPSVASIDTARSTTAPGPDGNNVNLDDETVSMVQTGLRYQTMVEAMNTKFRLLRTAIGSGS